MTDEELLKRFIDGDSTAMSELYLRHKRALYNAVLCAVHEPAIAEDIVQTVWFKLMDNASRIARFMDDDALAFELKQYLFRMAINARNDYFRRQGRLVPLDGDGQGLEPEQPPPDDLANVEDLLNCIANRTQGFRLPMRDAFWLTRDESMSYAAAAEVLGVARETVKDWVKQILRAIKPCREGFEHVG